MHSIAGMLKHLRTDAHEQQFMCFRLMCALQRVVTNRMQLLALERDAALLQMSEGALHGCMTLPLRSRTSRRLCCRRYCHALMQLLSFQQIAEWLAWMVRLLADTA